MLSFAFNFFSTPGATSVSSLRRLDVGRLGIAGECSAADQIDDNGTNNSGDTVVASIDAAHTCCAVSSCRRKRSDTASDSDDGCTSSATSATADAVASGSASAANDNAASGDACALCDIVVERHNAVAHIVVGVATANRLARTTDGAVLVVVDERVERRDALANAVAAARQRLVGNAGQLAHAATFIVFIVVVVVRVVVDDRRSSTTTLARRHTRLLVLA